MAMLVSRCGNQLLRICSVQRCVAFLSLEGGASGGAKKKKRPPEIRINLIEKTSLTVVSMESAQKLANRRKVQLIEVPDPAHWMIVGNRRAYEFLAPSNKVSSKKKDDYKCKGFKGLKTVIFKASIEENDVATKLKQLTKWVSSGFVIEIAVDVSDKSSDIRSKLEEQIKDAAKLPGTVKRNSSTFLRVQYEPLLKSDTNKEESSETLKEGHNN